jgi:hypothetical protein
VAYFLKNSAVFITVVILFLALTSGCAPKNTIGSGSVDPSHIYQSYDVSGTWYGTTAVAMFRDGGPAGKVIELAGPAQVEHNGGILKKDRRVYSDTAAYVLYSQDIFRESSFLFTDPAGKKYRNSLTIEPVEIATEDRFTADRGKDLVLRLSRAVRDDETLSTTIAVSANRSPNAAHKKSLIKLENNFFGDRSTVIIKQLELLSLSSGQGAVSVQIFGVKKIEEAAPAGGKMSYDYGSKQIYFTLPD